jgi:hypothetical protein
MFWFHRVRRRIRLLLFFGVVVAVLAVAGATWVADDDPPEPGLSLDCLPFTPPHDIAGMNRLVARYRSTSGFVGADVGASLRLQDGRGIWVFGDTLRQPGFQGEKFVRNSMLMFSPGCATVVMPRDHGAVVPDRADGVGYWPMDLAASARDGYDLVGVSLQRVRATGSGIFDFEILGPAFALFKVPVGKAPQLLLHQEIGADDPDPRRPMWGAAVEPAGRWVYLYGTASPGKHLVFGRSLQVARTLPEHLTDQRAWQYWDGRHWQHRANRAAILIPAEHGVSQVLSVFHRGGSWYAVSKRDEYLGTDLIIWKAPGPTGPFTASAPLARIPSNSADGLLRYMPLAHPDLLPSPDSVVVSYSRNVADFHRLMKDPTLYRPRFLQVPLP